MNYDAMTNSEKYQQEQLRNKVQKEKEEAILKQAIFEITQKDNANILLQFLKDISLWDLQDNNIDKEILAYQKGRRDIWLILRNFIPRDILANIEIDNKYRIKLEGEN